MKDFIDEEGDYYKLPCGYGGFRGQVIKLSAKEYEYLFQSFSTVSDYDFREKLYKMDEWFHDKPYKLYMKAGWIKWITKWLAKETVKE